MLVGRTINGTGTLGTLSAINAASNSAPITQTVVVVSLTCLIMGLLYRFMLRMKKC